VFTITIFEIIVYILCVVITIVGILSGILNKQISIKAKANITLSFMIVPFFICVFVLIDILLRASSSKWPPFIFVMPFTFLGIFIPQYIRFKRDVKKNGSKH